MKPITPTRILGGSILAEGSPVSVGGAKVYRGVDVGIEVGASGPRVGAAAQGPYRGRPAVGPAVAPVPVIVREPHDLAYDEPEVQVLFEQSTRARQSMTGSPAPRLIRAMGRGDQVLASVEEYVCGARLEDVLGALRARAAQMPPGLALAVAQGLVPLWITAASASPEVRFALDPVTVLLDAGGHVRALPEYEQDHARQAVGAAVALLRAPVAYLAPEQIVGRSPDPRSGIFTLGILLYEMLAGAHPIAAPGVSMFEILSGMANHELPPLRQRRSDLHPTVTALVHRCLARDPGQRFASWREFSLALAAVQALFPVTGPAEIARHVEELVPTPTPWELPPVDLPHAWWSLPSSGYHTVSPSAPDAPALRPAALSPARKATVLDPAAIYVGVDARPMVAASKSLLVDARPVTRDEMERFFIMTGTLRPAQLGASYPVTGADACTSLAVEVAEAYADWTGKRLPTEAEWEAAVAALGPARLGTGEVWEWTASPHPSGGRVVRGGRWRDQATTMEARPENRSFAISPAADLGFRCVVDVRTS